MMKVARWCMIYSLGASIAMAIVNVISEPTFDWYLVCVGLVLSGGAYFYLERIVEPQLQKNREEQEKREAEKEIEIEGERKHKRRPKLKKK